MKAPKDKKPLNIAQCVEILLREGVDKPETWMAVKPYVAQDTHCVGGDAWGAEAAMLAKHHVKETTFLFEIIKELCEQVKTLDEQLDEQTEVNTKG